MKLLLLAAFLGLACASGDNYGKGYEKKEVVKHVEYSSGGYGDKHNYGSKQVYHGKYPGKCGNDGFYYNNENSFMICSNGNSYEQRCAPGSKNSGNANYQYGKDYYYHDFCDVNLVDHGYAAAHGGYGNRGNSYGSRGNNYGGYDGGYGGYGGYGRDNGYGGYGYGGNGYRGDGYRGDNYRGGYRGGYF